MTSGNRVVLLILLIAAAFAAAMILYATRSRPEAGPLIPEAAARELVESDNTVVGSIGGIRRIGWRDEREIGRNEVGLSAVVFGARDSGRYYADVVLRDERWSVERASFVLPDGRRLPLLGDRPPALEPPPDPSPR